MTTNTDIVNLALQAIGTRTDVTDAELAAQSTNEAIQAMIAFVQTRDDLLRMAPWDCAMNFANLTWITAAPGTPENTSQGTMFWEKGLPPPPWSYMYQYPVDCLRACFIIPQWNTGFSGGVPITTAVTGLNPSFWSGPPVKFKVAIEQFYPVLSAGIIVSAGGVDYAVGDIITLPRGPTDETPIGAPVQLLVTSVHAPTGEVTGIAVIPQIQGYTATMGGSYFGIQSGNIPQGSTTGSGTGAVFALTQGPKGSQRVILTNQEYATLAYCKQVTDPNVMDSLFQTAWSNVLGAAICMGLTGDRKTANSLIAIANASIIEARKADGNEGLTVNDVLPDWIRARGIDYPTGNAMNGPAFDWGGLWPTW